MRFFLTFLPTLICIAQLFSQRHIAPEPLRLPGSLTPLPLVFTGATPDVFLPSDSVKRPHIRTHIVEFSSNLVMDNNYLLEGLKQQGLKEGVDGIVLSEYRKVVPGEVSMIGSMSGIGIKYTDNLAYLDTILRQKVITTFDQSGIAGKTAVIDFDWYGNMITPMQSEDAFFYSDSMSSYDVAVIMNRQSTFYAYKSFGGANPSRVVAINTWPVKITHTVEGDFVVQYFKTVQVSRVAGKRLRVKIIPVYDGPAITGAMVVSDNSKENPLLYLHYRYDSRGRIVEERWEKLIDGKRTLWLEVENRFFDHKDELQHSLSSFSRG